MRKGVSFNRPQGMCLEGETLYVADTENHAIRAVDLKDHTVTTIAGIGQPGSRHSPAGLVGAGQDNATLQPLGRDPACR